MAKEMNKDNKDKEVKEDVKKAKKESKPKTDKKASTKKDNKKSFFKEFKAELKKVSWPTFKQLVNNTGAVLAIVILFAVVVFILDVIFENLNNFGVEKLKALVTSSSTEIVEDNSENVETEASNEANGAEANTAEENSTVETEEKATETSDVENSSETNN